MLTSSTSPPPRAQRPSSAESTFRERFIGYDWQDATLAAGDAQWGVPGVNYGVGLRRMEWPGNDTITFTLPGSVSLSLYAAAAYVDQIRIYVVY